MRTIIVDDEPWMLKRFAIECEGLPDVQLLGSFRSPLKALDFVRENSVELAFLDVEMPEMNGLELAGKLRKLNPELIIIYISAYDSYMTEAFKTKTADYYIMKPYNTGDIEAAIDRARLLSGRLRKAIFVRTFGSFELFVDNNPVAFKDCKAQELLALLVDRNGGVLSASDAALILWRELPASEGEISFFRTLKRLDETLSALHLNGIINRNEQGVFIHTDIIDCDLYRFLDGDPKTVRQYFGEYMNGYGWAEATRRKLRQQSEQLDTYRDAQTRNALFANVRTLNDPPLTLRYMNDSFLALVGYTREEISERFHDSLRAMIVREDFNRFITANTETTSEVECRLACKSGDELWVLYKSEPPKMVSDGLCEKSGIFVDISELKSEQRHLEYAAQRDGLTGLFNRASAQEKIRQYLASSYFIPEGALVLMDVDNFKAVNDTYGHPFADTVLTDIAAILTREFRSSDIVCRLGGDEMLIFLKGIESESAAREKLKSASETLRSRLSAKTQRGELSCSFGGAMCPQNGGDFETLYSNADRALYKAKAKKNCTVWISDMEVKGEGS